MVAILPVRRMEYDLGEPLITEAQIAQKIREVAAQIRSDYFGKDLVILMVLKGAICLVADFIRVLAIPFELQVIQCSSYGAKGTERGPVQISGLDRLQIHHRDVLIVDDMFDAGQTMTALREACLAKNPRTLKSMVLLSKNVPRATAYRPDYILFPVENVFVVGYGLDFKEQYRGLSGIYALQKR
jgi:hypoxanthine phosphoribosyltransferase